MVAFWIGNFSDVGRPRTEPSIRAHTEVGVEAGVAVEATRFTQTDKQANFYSLSRMVTDASLTPISHVSVAQGGVRFY